MVPAFCVARGPRGGDRGGPHALAQLGGEHAGAGVSSIIFWLRRWMEQSRSPSWITLPWRVGHDLELDVVRVQDELLEVHLVVVEAGAGLGAGLLEEVVELRGVEDLAHATPAAAGGRLDEDRVADLVGDAVRLGDVGHRAVGPRDHRDAGGLHELARGGLVAHGGDHLGGGPDEGDALVGAALGEVRVLGQEAVAGVDGVAVRRLGHGEDRVHIEVALGRRRRTDAVGVLGELHVQRLAVGLGVDHHRLDIQLAAGAEHAHGDLAAVGNEDTLEHGAHASL